MNILCRLFGHRRSRRRIMPWRDSWQTECSLCSTRLTRVRHGQWVPIGVVASIGSEFSPARRTRAD
jgi:hypothetical protein